TPTAITLGAQVVFFSNVQTATVAGGAGDSATLSGSDAADTLTNTPTTATLATAGVSLTAAGLVTVTAFGGPGALASLSDGPGHDVLTATPAYVRLSGAGMLGLTASGFGQVSAFASAGNDLALLFGGSGPDLSLWFGAAGTDLFVATPTFAYFQAGSSLN